MANVSNRLEKRIKDDMGRKYKNYHIIPEAQLDTILAKQRDTSPQLNKRTIKKLFKKAENPMFKIKLGLVNPEVNSLYKVWTLCI